MTRTIDAGAARHPAHHTGFCKPHAPRFTRAGARQPHCAHTTLCRVEHRVLAPSAARCVAPVTRPLSFDTPPAHTLPPSSLAAVCIACILPPMHLTTPHACPTHMPVPPPTHLPLYRPHLPGPHFHITATGTSFSCPHHTSYLCFALPKN